MCVFIEGGGYRYTNGHLLRQEDQLYAITHMASTTEMFRADGSLSSGRALPWLYSVMLPITNPDERVPPGGFTLDRTATHPWRRFGPNPVKTGALIPAWGHWYKIEDGDPQHEKE